MFFYFRKRMELKNGNPKENKQLNGGRKTFK